MIKIIKVIVEFYKRKIFVFTVVMHPVPYPFRVGDVFPDTFKYAYE